MMSDFVSWVRIFGQIDRKKYCFLTKSHDDFPTNFFKFQVQNFAANILWNWAQGIFVKNMTFFIIYIVNLKLIYKLI